MADNDLSFGGEEAGNDPFELFARWLKMAQDSELNDPNAMALATVDQTGSPNVRIVLMKGFDQDGFVFYTNFGSAKGSELLATPIAAFAMHWKSLRKQVRVRGPVHVVSDAEADAYYLTRPTRSKVGAWVSKQSTVLQSRQDLFSKVANFEEETPELIDIRPAHWSGFRIVPVQIEFWSDGEFRLHDRIVFDRTSVEGPWATRRLYP